MAARALLLLVAASVLRGQVEAAGACWCDTGNTNGCDDFCNEVCTCNPTGIWVPVQNCQLSNDVCRGGICVAANSQEAIRRYCHNRYNAMCRDAGVYASPWDCRSYYECTSDETIPSQCGGTTFDACTGGCTAQLQTCSVSSVTPCTQTMRGISRGDDRKYYICSSSLVPTWYTCPGTRRYSVTQGTCVDVGYTGACGTVCGSATSLPGPIAHGSSSCSYVWCHSRENFEMVACRVGWHYDHAQRACVYGACT